jgi:SAM-dependent methyltransferase
MAFASDWLALREAADRAARDKNLLDQAIALAGPAPVIVDLGCGTGSSVRTLAPLLPTQTTWRLVDNDQALLDIAATDAGPSATLHLLDITDVHRLPLDGATLVTCSALLDLVTEEWLRELARTLTVPFYAALTYNGMMRWIPALETDQAITEAFNAHQRHDKGLGPALGPTAADTAAQVFEEAGFRVVSSESLWSLESTEAPLQRALVEGIGQAAKERGDEDALSWATHRTAAAEQTQCLIGHTDVVAIPPGAPQEVSDAER